MRRQRSRYEEELINSHSLFLISVKVSINFTLTT